MSFNIKVFKLNYSGSLEKLSQEATLKNFNLFDILIFYIIEKKRLYIWIGKKAAQALKNLIPSIREIIVKDFPELKILRNFTIESGFEPKEFLEILELSESTINEYIKSLETNLLPVFSKINRLKDEADKSFISENYEKAVALAEDIIKLAKEIKDDSLEADQMNFIREAKSRAKAKRVLQNVEVECSQLLDQFNKLLDTEDYKEAHKIVEEFKGRYENDLGLTSIPVVQELFLKDDNLLYSLREEQINLKKKLEALEDNFKNLIEHTNFFKAETVLIQVKYLLKKVIDENINNKWKSIENDYLEIKKKKKENIDELSRDAIDLIDRREFLEAVENFEKIINNLEKMREK